MPIFEIQANGKSFEVDAPNHQAAIAAISGGQPASFGDRLQQLWENPPPGPSIIGLARHTYDAVKGSVQTANDIYKPAGTEITEGQAAARDALPQQTYEAAKVFSPVTPTARAMELGGQIAQQPIAAPSTQELKAAATAGYNSARNSGVELKPESLGNLSTQIKTNLNGDGINEVLAPKTFGLLEKIGTAPDGAVVTTDNFRTLQRSLSRAAQSTDPTERLAATRALGLVSSHLENVPQGDILRGTSAELAGANNAIREANANYAAAKRSDMIQGKTDRAELNAGTANSGQNLDNALRQQVKSILSNPKALRGFSQEEIAQMNEIARGTAGANIIRHIGNLLGGGGGLGAMTTGAAGAYAAGPVGLAAPLAGFALRKAANEMTAKNVAKLDELVRSRSPLAKQQLEQALVDAGGRNANSLQLLLSSAMVQDPTGQLNRAIVNLYRTGGSIPAAADSDQDNGPRI